MLLDYRTHDPDLIDYRGTEISSPYFQGIESVYQYCSDVLTGVRKASENEKKVCQRFIDDHERDDIRLDLNIFNLVIAVANSLKHSKGPIAGQPILLLPWMMFALANMFCWKYTDKAASDLVGQRRFQKAIIHVSRGNAKTQLAAIVSIISLLLTKNGSPTVTTSASTRKQASICFAEIKAQIQSSTKTLRKRFRLLTNEIAVKGGGAIFATSSEAGTVDGLRVTTGILDECHTHPNSSIHDVITSGTASSSDPLVLMISTAGAPHSFYHDQYKYAVAVLDRIYENDRLFVQVFEADAGLADDSDEAFEQANPSIDHAVSRSTLRANYANSMVSPAARAGFATKHLNRFFEFHEAQMIDTDTIGRCVGLMPDDESLRKMECYVGIDLASVSDLSTVSIVFVDKNRLYIKTQSFLPRVALDAVPANLTKFYREAVQNRVLTLSEIHITDEDEIHEYVKEITKRYRVQQIGIDAAAGGHRWAIRHEEEWNGYEVLAVNQGFGLSEPLARLIKAAHAGQLTFGSDEVLLNWAMHNARTELGQFGDLKLVRPKSDNNLKIDPCVASVIALSLVPAVEFSPQMR